MAYGVTPEGFKAKPFDVVLEDIVARQRATIDAGLDTSEHEAIGNVNASIAMSIAEVWEAAQDVDDQLDPDAAEGEQLDSVASLTATTRDDAAKSRVVATVNLNNGTALLAGTHIASVDGNPLARFTPEANFTAPSTGNHSVAFVAMETGPVVANAGTLTEIDTTLSGWNSITNAEDATLGSNVESDESMRIRREEELAAQGGGTFDGMRADILRIEDVTACTILENLTDAVDANGLPPGSFECLVLGGDEEKIAKVIWANKPLGVVTYGSTTVEVEDSQGVEHDVLFSRPTELRIYAAVDIIELSETIPYGGDAAVREAMRSSAETVGDPGYLAIGSPAIARRFESAVLDRHNGVSGVVDLDIGLSLTAITTPSSGTRRIDVGPREIAALDTADIYIPVGA